MRQRPRTRSRATALLVLLALFTSSFAGVVPTSSAQQPNIVQEHWYHSYLTLTNDVQSWAGDYPEIVLLTTAGTTLHGRQQWVVQISNWANDTKPDGSPKEKVYIDGGHHGNEHLGTELAFLSAVDSDFSQNGHKPIFNIL